MHKGFFKKYILGIIAAVIVFLIIQFSVTVVLSVDKFSPIPSKINDNWRISTAKTVDAFFSDKNINETIELKDFNNYIPERKYAKISRNFDSLRKGQLLFVKTFYSPVIVIVDGVVLYNSFIEETVFSRSAISKVLIEEDYSGCSVEIVYRLSGNRHTEAWLVSNQYESFQSIFFFISLLLAAFIFGIGAFFIMCCIGARFYRKGTRRLIFSSLIFTSSGLLIALRTILSVYASDSINLFKLETALVLIIEFGILCLSFCFKEKFHLLNKALALLHIFYISLFVFSVQPSFTYTLYEIIPYYTLFLIICSSVSIWRCLPEMKLKIQIPLIALMFSSYFFTINYCFSFILDQSYSLSILSGILMVLCGLDYLPGKVFNAITVHHDSETNTQSTVLFNKALTLSAQVFSSKSMAEFCRNMAQSLRTIIFEDMIEASGNAVGITDTLRVSVATKENGYYSIVYSDNEQELCNFDIIEKRINESNNDYIMFGVTYIDVYLRQNNEVYLICHISGMKRVISEDLKGVLKSTYANISYALEALNLKNEIVEMQNMVFFNLAHITEARNQETGEHIRRVSEYTKVICLAYGMSAEESELVSQASMMHDLGKLAISEKIIKKKGALTKQERSIMKNHVVWGYNILSGSPGEFISAAAIIAQQHHEQIDGSGYLGLVGDEIHLYAQIVAVADVFDALTTERSYKKAWSLNEAKIFINERVDSHFERKAVDAFNKSFDKIIKIYNSSKNL